MISRHFSSFQKLRSILTKKDKLFSVFLLFMLIIGMIMEAIGLTALLPVISSIVSDKNPFLFLDWDFINSFYENNSKLKMVYFCFTILLLIYIVKTIFLILLTHLQNKFIFNLSASLSNSLFKRYLAESYDFHLDNNSASMVKNFQVEIANFIAYLRGALNIIIEIFLAFSILFTLILLEPYPAILIGLTFSILAIFLLGITKKTILNYSKHNEELNALISKLSFESFSGIKDLKINNASIYFLRKFKETQNSKAKNAANYNTLNNSPRFLFELIAVIGIILLILFKLVILKESESLISSVGIFVAATFRMMPSINRIVSGFQAINYYERSLDILYNSLISKRFIESIIETKKLKFDYNIEFKNITFYYKKKQNLIFEKLNLIIPKGNIMGLIGDSGSGKSTFIDLLTGLLKPIEGSISIDSNQIFGKNTLEWRNSIGYVPQKIFLTDDTILKNIAFGFSEESIDKIALKDSIEKSELSELISKLDKGFNTTVGEGGAKLSGGQLQRIGIARALYRKPDLLILDESTASLDKQTEKTIFKSLLKLKKDMTILIISHDLNNLSICDEIYKIENKKLLEYNYK